MKKRAVIWVCALALALSGGARCFAYGDSGYVEPEAVAVDAVVVRPFCLAATVIGSALFVVSLPFAIPSKSVHRAAEALVVRPARATFTRPLGDIDSLSDY